MVVFYINHTNYQKLLKDLAIILGRPQKQDDFIALAEPVGKATIKVFSLFDELQVFLIDAVFQNTIMTIREKSDDQHYILHFDEINITDKSFKFTVGEELLQKTNTLHAVARLTSNILKILKRSLPASI